MGLGAYLAAVTKYFSEENESEAKYSKAPKPSKKSAVTISPHYGVSGETSNLVSVSI